MAEGFARIETTGVRRVVRNTLVGEPDPDDVDITSQIEGRHPLPSTPNRPILCFTASVLSDNNFVVEGGLGDISLYQIGPVAVIWTIEGLWCGFVTLGERPADWPHGQRRWLVVSSSDDFNAQVHMDSERFVVREDDEPPLVFPKSGPVWDVMWVEQRGEVEERLGVGQIQQHPWLAARLTTGMAFLG